MSQPPTEPDPQPEPRPVTGPPVTIVNEAKGPGTLGSIIVALVAIIGTVAGGAITGAYTYQTTSHNTDTQHFNELEDKRRTVYADYLSAATTLCIALQTGTPASKGIPLLTDLVNKESLVLLISRPQMQTPTEQLSDFLTEGSNDDPVRCDGKQFYALRSAFLKAAKQDFPDTY
jgi:hypothetical protein